MSKEADAVTGADGGPGARLNISEWMQEQHKDVMRDVPVKQSSVVFDPASGEVITDPISPERMVELYAVAIRQADRFRDMATKLELDMLQYMEAQGATAIPHAGFDVTVVQTNSYNKAAFKPLLEIFNDADLNKCYTAPYSKRVYVEEVWSTQQVKAAAKRYGTKALTIVEGAITQGPRRLKFSVIETVDKAIG